MDLPRSTIHLNPVYILYVLCLVKGQTVSNLMPATTAPTPELQTKEPSMFDSPEWTGVYPEETKTATKQKLVGIRFQPVGKVYHYNSAGFDDLKVGDWVIVDTVRGRQMGQVATFKPPKDPQAGYKRIERRAAGRDMAMRHFYENKELEAMIACRAESAALRLPVKIVRAEYSFDGQTLTFLFSSDQEERVEVSALRDVMSRLYRSRIEFRQISPREVAKIIGGMGACGIEQRCCSRFLTDFSPISIKHAKEQNLSLNPHDITGMCGRLRCCLVYEYEQYVEARRHLPKLKSMIGTPLGQGKVVEILHLRDAVRVKIGEGPEAREVEFHREQLVPLEELKRLQEKAMSGTCDRHESGGCDCGRGRAGAAESSSEPADELPAAAQAYIDANVPTAESSAEQPSQKHTLDRPASDRSGLVDRRARRQVRRDERRQEQRQERRQQAAQSGEPKPNEPKRRDDPRPSRGAARRQYAKPAKPALQAHEPGASGSASDEPKPDAQSSLTGANRAQRKPLLKRARPEPRNPKTADSTDSPAP